MSRKFKTPDYEATLKQTINLGEALPPHHLARFVVDGMAHLDLSAIYPRSAPFGVKRWPPKSC